MTRGRSALATTFVESIKAATLAGTFASDRFELSHKAEV
jgi:hypothetical protein